MYLLRSGAWSRTLAGILPGPSVLTEPSPPPPPGPPRGSGLCTEGSDGATGDSGRQAAQSTLGESSGRSGSHRPVPRAGCVLFTGARSWEDPLRGPAVWQRVRAPLRETPGEKLRAVPSPTFLSPRRASERASATTPLEQMNS